MERCLPELVWHLEDLRVGQSYPNYYVARLASKFVKVVLSGTGGDELFAGYPWRYYRAVVNDDFDDYVEKYYRFWHRLVPNEVLPRLLPARRLARDRGPAHARHLPRRASRTPHAPESPEEYVNHSLYFEAKTFLHGLLVVEDKLSMAHGLETRVPFLDNDLVDFAQRVPVRLKLRDLEHVVKLDENEPGPKTERYFERTRDGKLLLRQVMRALRARARSPTRSSRASRARTRAGSAATASTTSARSLLDDDAAIYEFLDPTACARSSTSTSRDARTGGCCSGRCSPSSTGAGPSSRGATVRVLSPAHAASWGGTWSRASASATSRGAHSPAAGRRARVRRLDRSTTCAPLDTSAPPDR